MQYIRCLEPVWDQVDIYHGGEAFLLGFARLQRELGHLFAAHWCQEEVCNGGLEQFFSNSAGVLAPEAVEGFRAIGQPQIADLLGDAMALLGTPYERDRKRRKELLNQLPDDAFDRIAEPRSDLNQRFFKLIETESGGFVAAADRYAQALTA